MRKNIKNNMNDVKYLTFYENWRQLRNCCTLEEWYELETMIFKLRFDGVDTDPNSIPNIKLQGFWVIIRPSILKSNRNTRHNNKKKEITETDITCGKLSPTINGNPLNDTDTPSRLQCLTDGKKTVVLAQGGLSVAGRCRCLTKDSNTSIEKEGYIPYSLQA